MKVLKITYGDVTIHDAEVDEFSWTDGLGYVTVTGKVKTSTTGGAGAGLLEMLTQASRRKTDAVARRVTEPVAEPSTHVDDDREENQ